MDLAKKALGVLIIMSTVAMVVAGVFLVAKLNAMLEKKDYYDYRSGIGAKPEDKPVWWD
jgi:uncharacterized membrane protein YidH (DUF202 family)